MPFIIACIICYMIYENSFSEMFERELVNSHTIVACVILILIFISICLRAG